MEMSRRTFLGASAAVALTQQPRLLRRRIPVVQEDHRVVIIGSGFGGGVSALRLAQAGVNDIVVLERGRRWPTGPNANTFPSVRTGMDERLLFYGTAPVSLPFLNRPLLPGPIAYAGILEAHVNPNLSVLNSAGVGGGSLVYQGMTLQPSRDVFEETFPSKLDYDELDRVHYPRVAKMLHAAPAPDEVLNSPSYLAPRIFRRNALAAGYSVGKIPMPIDWNYAIAELKGQMAPCYTNGDGFMGVNNGGKFSVDVTYIKEAEATGRVKVKPLHNVQRIARTRNGRWRVEVDETDVHGKVLAKKFMTTRTLIVTAGCVNTNKILLRAQYEDAIPNLPDQVGKGWGTNGDRIVAWTSTTDDFGKTQGGPVVFGSKEWSNPKMANTVIQASMPPLPISSHTTVTVGFGVSEARGAWHYVPATDDIVLDWKREADAELHTRIWQRMTRIAGKGGVLVDSHTPVPMTWHPLGGACMDVVTDLEGRVHDNPGLYVLDGAFMPGTTAACNPSMSIAALAERAMDRITRNDVGARI